MNQTFRLENYAAGQWVRGTGAGTPLIHAVTGETIAEAGSEGLAYIAIGGNPTGDAEMLNDWWVD